MRRRRALAGAAFAVLLAAVSGCGSAGGEENSASPLPEPAASLSADEAWQRYGDLPRDLTAALDQEFGDLAWTELDDGPSVGEGGGGCALNLSRQRSAQVLLTVDDADLSGTRAALDPVLAEYGFAPLSGATTDGGGQTVVVSEHPDGGDVTLTTRSDTVVDVEGVPLDPAGCEPGEYVPADGGGR